MNKVHKFLLTFILSILLININESYGLNIEARACDYYENHTINNESNILNEETFIKSSSYKSGFNLIKSNEIPTIEIPKKENNAIKIIIIIVGSLGVIGLIIFVILITKKRNNNYSDIEKREKQNKKTKASDAKKNNSRTNNKRTNNNSRTKNNRINNSRSNIPEVEIIRNINSDRTGIHNDTIIQLIRVNSISQNTFSAKIESSVVIGSNHADIIIFDDRSVSPHHCEIIQRGNLFYLIDLKSDNGTFCEGERVWDEVPIMDGTILTIGVYKYKVKIIVMK